MTHQLPGSEAERLVIVRDLRRFCFVMLKFVRPAVAKPTERLMCVSVSSARRGHFPQSLLTGRPEHFFSRSSQRF